MDLKDFPGVQPSLRDYDFCMRSRHFASLHAGLMTIAPPALETPLLAPGLRDVSPAS
jgi:hypothetical protein